MAWHGTAQIEGKARADIEDLCSFSKHSFFATTHWCMEDLLHSRRQWAVVAAKNRRRLLAQGSGRISRTQSLAIVFSGTHKTRRFPLRLYHGYKGCHVRTRTTMVEAFSPIILKHPERTKAQAMIGREGSLSTQTIRTHTTDYGLGKLRYQACQSMSMFGTI